jgi:transcriptional regulator with XRE-family HTH domain
VTVGADRTEGESGDEIAKVVGTRIAIRRQKLGLSQEELANLAGLHRTTISPLELGKGGFRAETLVRIAGVLEVPPIELLDGVYWVPDGGGEGHFTDDPPTTDGG